ncbi:hypothetical protein HAX54_014491, partial [Datura stramonium]|nr:hypothetical protein [Datura stramonium]
MILLKGKTSGFDTCYCKNGEKLFIKLSVLSLKIQESRNCSLNCIRKLPVFREIEADYFSSFPSCDEVNVQFRDEEPLGSCGQACYAFDSIPGSSSLSQPWGYIDKLK